MKRGEKKLIKRITDMMFRSLQFSCRFGMGDFIFNRYPHPINLNTWLINIIREKDRYICARFKITVTIKNEKYEVEKISFNKDYMGFVGKKKLIEEIKKSCRL